MKAASLLEHKCFFLVFVFTGQQYIKIQLKRVFTPIIWIIAKKCLFLHSNEYPFAFIAESSISIIKKTIKKEILK